jgi:hypothetical protein
MAIQLSTVLRTAMAATYEVTIGTSPYLKIYSGSPPANCAAAASGTLLADIALPSDWLATASAGAVAMAGTWAGAGAAPGTAGHYRITDTAGTTCHEQGTVTATGGGGDMTIDNVSIASGQAITVTAYGRTMPNA